MTEHKEDTGEKKSLNFIEAIVEEDLRTGRDNGRVHTRFPPEPNGYLHIGHAKAICLDFGIAEKYGGKCNLRFDDTNPTKEDVEYVDSIKEDIHWLGFDWEDREYYASDYFGKLYDFAIDLIKKGLAYVDDQSSEEIASQKGTPTEPGKSQSLPGPFGGGEPGPVPANECRGVPEGSRVLRAKIDMASSKHAHARSGDLPDPVSFPPSHWRYLEGISHV